MLGRSRMRRGVSLEVIVEEDDSAEVSFDPVPLMEEEDDDDEDEEDSEHGTGGSAPGSPRDDDGIHGDGHDDGKSSTSSSSSSAAAEERRKRRERRRTIGGLSRFRSVSCEALTLLDTSDMDSCCSEWDDDDDLTSSGSSNYVTLNRPISRRRIIQNIHSQCDSEDSGIEYHSNEDDHVLEDHSSNEDQVDKEDEHDIHEKETDSEEYMEEQESLEDDREEEDECATITLESEDEDEDKNSLDGMPTDTHRNEDEIYEREGKGKTEESEKNQYQNNQNNNVKPVTKFAYSPNEALENDKIIIVETTPSVPIKKTQYNYLEAAEEELRLKREAYTIRNKEVRLAELPRPHTVKSVKQLFENLNTPVQHFHTWRDLGRFRDIKSNPSSKILRFDRNDNDAPVSRSQLMSFTLPRLPSQGGCQNTQPQSPRSLTASTQTINEVGTPERSPKKAPRNYQETPISRILTQSMTPKGTKGENRQQHPKTTKSDDPPRQQQQVMTQNGEKVVLRKPIVKGFNVKRALMENPRNFLPHDHPLNSQQKKQSSQRDTRHKLGHLQKQLLRHHHHSDVHDRSDTESLASDISDDSGVSNDSITSTSSSSTPSSYRSFDAYASDPSFKWIDPAVMAKIRSVGTTVIFFGPRQRPRQDGTLPRGTHTISSGLQINRGGQHTLRASQTSAKRNSVRQLERNAIPIPAPRIVGVVRKQSAGNSANSSPSASVHPTPAQTPTPTDVHSDDSRASSPLSRCEEESTPRKAGRWRTESDTVVYNFTRPQPPAVYF